VAATSDAACDGHWTTSQTTVERNCGTPAGGMLPATERRASASSSYHYLARTAARTGSRMPHRCRLLQFLAPAAAAVLRNGNSLSFCLRCAAPCCRLVLLLLNRRAVCAEETPSLSAGRTRRGSRRAGGKRRWRAGDGRADDGVAGVTRLTRGGWVFVLACRRRWAVRQLCCCGSSPYLPRCAAWRAQLLFRRLSRRPGV